MMLLVTQTSHRNRVIDIDFPFTASGIVSKLLCQSVLAETWKTSGPELLGDQLAYVDSQ